jgi:hypothetical protein
MKIVLSVLGLIIAIWLILGVIHLLLALAVPVIIVLVVVFVAYHLGRSSNNDKKETA